MWACRRRRQEIVERRVRAMQVVWKRREERERERKREREREREIVERCVRAMQVAAVAAAICNRLHCVAFNWIRLG